MKITEQKNYIIIEDTGTDINSFSHYIENEGYPGIKGKNVIVNLSAYGELLLADLLGFLKVSDHHRKNKNSFVIVNDTIMIDEVPEELAVVPTLQEAEDFIQMEELERELGF